MLNYKLAIAMHKLFTQCQPEPELVQLNFQLNQNPRITHANYFVRQNYDAGKNMLLNGKIKKSWLELSLNTFKIKCKALFLTN